MPITAVGRPTFPMKMVFFHKPHGRRTSTKMDIVIH
jgi:hypothetical protein